MHNIRLGLVLTFSLLGPCAFAQAPVPATASGHVLEAWLAAFNSGDRTRIQAFVDQYGWPQRVSAMVAFRNQTGGFDLLSIEHSDARSIEFMVKERASDTHGIGQLVLSKDVPPHVTDMTLRAIPPGAKVLGFTIDAATRKSVIDGAIDKLREGYVFPDKAEAMAKAIRRHRRAGDYDKITSGAEFARRLTKDLRDVSHDLHLRMSFSPVAMPPRPANFKPSAQALQQRQQQMSSQLANSADRSRASKLAADRWPTEATIRS